MGRHSASDKRRHSIAARGRESRRAGAGRGVRATANTRPVGGPASSVDGRRPSRRTDANARLEGELKRRKTKRVLLGVALSLLALVGVSLVAGWAFMHSVQSEMQVEKPQRKALRAVLKPEDPGDPFTVLLIGADYRPKETTWRADTLILAKIDPREKKVWMLSIPRDTRVNIPGEGYQKINQAHFIGGPELTVRTVSKLVGVPINHYAEVNFRGFKALVEAMGGVWVDVPVEIDDIKADNSPHHRAKHIDKGYQKLDGEHALTFVRSRDFPDADFGRMKNQQIFFAAVADQIATQTSITRVPGLVRAVAPFIGTDMSLVQMVKTGRALSTAGSKNLFTATLKGEWKSPYVWLDEDIKKKLVADLKAGRSFDSTVSPEAAIAPADITVDVRNGGGVADSADQAAGVLEKAGFNVEAVGNAKSFTYPTTLVVYDGSNKPAAQQVAAQLPGSKLVNGNGQYSYSARVLVVVGKDWRVPTPVQSHNQ